MKTIFSLKDIHFAYGTKEVLRGISLDVCAGDIVGILGPNGVGKSTLLKLLGGTLSPARGEILLEGTPLRDLASKVRAQRVALVPQESHFPFAFSALETVLMGRAPYLPTFGFESRKDLEIAAEAMRMTDCEMLAARNINELSGGERQRVVLARALAQKPKLLLLDEPTTFLDIRHTRDFLSALRTHNRETGATIVCVLHDLNTAASLCNRIILLKEGAIAADGEPACVITEPSIRSVFGADVVVGRDGPTRALYCIPR